ncbi:MAG: transporter substrate-binding domain-containing protein [Ramlibacter sp.]|jgi:cyclohexadienyl dehydratase|uniref:transporter substrate-binding domain-containing protein n=1 Tax=Ramlibacter sp. TaxID=1917967 RepID=UPI00261DAC9D|nr:transporter substrate-binding domain-containing protein [Ramlibacter sp.]MDH4375559.1 transporter substrate-binding domain-containing protein [Ramlibacter sp.]
MKFFKSLLSVALLAMAILNNPAAAQGAPAKSRLQTVMERGTLRVGTTGDFNPMSMRDAATNSYRGFDVEAMEQLAKDMGVKVEWVPAEWATLVAGITSNRYDIFSGASLSIARAKTVAFSDPYIEAGTVPVIRKADAARLTGWSDLNRSGTQISVSLGTVFEEQAKAHFPQATVRGVEKPATGYQEVLAGRAVATITSNVEAATLLKTYPNLTTISKAELRNKRPFAYPLPQGDPVWSTFVNNWVALKKSEGFFDALETKWLGR